MSDLINRLRAPEYTDNGMGAPTFSEFNRATMLEAADRIDELEGAIAPFVRAVKYCRELNQLKPGKNARFHDFVISDEFIDAFDVMEVANDN